MTCKRVFTANFLSVVSICVAILSCQVAQTQASSPQSIAPPLFLPAVPYDSGGIFPEAVAVADLNGDGKPDLIVANLCSTNTGCLAPPPNGTVGVLLGKGDGTFQPTVSYNLGGVTSGLQSVAVADVNGDGKPDLLVAIRSANFGEGGAGVLLGNGDGTFQAPATYDSGGQGAWSIAVGDFNADGKPDLVLANADSANLGVLLGNGDGTFQPPVIYNTGGQLRSVAVADVNNDGKPDLLAANLCQNPLACTGDGIIGVLLGNGDGTFQAAVAYDSGMHDRFLVIRGSRCEPRRQAGHSGIGRLW